MPRDRRTDGQTDRHQTDALCYGCGQRSNITADATAFQTVMYKVDRRRRHRERKCADTIGTVPVHWPAIPNAKISVYFSNKTHVSNFNKQHSETVMVWNYQNADCSLRKKFHCVIYYNFRQTFVPYVLCCK